MPADNVDGTDMIGDPSGVLYANKIQIQNVVLANMWSTFPSEFATERSSIQHPGRLRATAFRSEESVPVALWSRGFISF